MSEREIGSEYHYCAFHDTNSGEFIFPNIRKACDAVYTFSGRTAIETVLRNHPTLKAALLPSYCCEAMIRPFLDAGIQVSFYDVRWNNGLKISLDNYQDFDLILWCNYFGFRQKMPDLSSFVQNGGIILEDITHSYLSDTCHNTQSHYLIASIRKWFPVLSGGYCASLKYPLKVKPHTGVSSDFTRLKACAMKTKTVFLESGDQKLKEKYLQDFSTCNTWLADNYSDKGIDAESLAMLSRFDTKRIVDTRRENARIIYRYLDKCPGIVPAFALSDMDCPLFVPIICGSHDERDRLRRALIAQNVYCPIHWPRPSEKLNSNLYDLELSLICDQRYNAEDMERMMQAIYCFLTK